MLAQAKPSDRRLTNRDARPGLPAQAPSSALPCGLASPQNHGGEAARAPPSQIRALRLRSAGSGLGLQVPSHTPPPTTLSQTREHLELVRTPRGLAQTPARDLPR